MSDLETTNVVVCLFVSSANRGTIKYSWTRFGSFNYRVF